MDVRLCSFQNPAVGGMIENSLRSRGLHPISIYPLAFFAGGGDLWYELRIPEEEDRTAREIITEAGYANALAKR